jgi:RHS repeat-associated protein
MQDLQGSTRAVMNNGTYGSSAIIARHDYLPFGEEIWLGTGLRSSLQGYGTTDLNRQKYGLTERDDATGLDHTWWRKYESTAGRWTSPDPIGGSIADPQSFNHYAYTANDPVNLTDPDGLLPTTQCNGVIAIDPQSGERVCIPPSSFGVTVHFSQTDAFIESRGVDHGLNYGLLLSTIHLRPFIELRDTKEPKNLKQPCDTSAAAVRSGAQGVVNRISGSSVGTQNGQPVINFKGSYDETTAQLRKAGYYSGVLAYNPIDHSGGKEFRTYGRPGFHFKVVYPSIEVYATPGEPGYAIVNGSEPAVATDLHIDCNNPVGSGASGTIKHAGDFLGGHVPWWLPPMLIRTGP